MSSYAISDLMDYMRRYLFECDRKGEEGSLRGFYRWMKEHGHQYDQLETNLPQDVFYA